MGSAVTQALTLSVLSFSSACCVMTSALLSVDEARQRILGAVQPLGEREWIELRMALGRITAEDIL